MELHFYPAQHLLIVTNQRAVIGRYEAWGGPINIIFHGNEMQEEPTWPGSYVIEKAEAYHTPSWGFSKIKWGTRLKDLGTKKNDVLYQLPSGAWGSIEKDFKITRKEILVQALTYYKMQAIPATWVFNDFGPVAVRWFKDLNGNRILDGKERLSGQMFHTTPLNEAQHAQKQAVQLSPSHGCIHLKPADRDRLFAIGAFKPKTEFTIHKHNERY